MDVRVSWSPAALDDRVQGSEVLVAAVVHGRRQLEPLLDQINSPF